MAQIFQPVVAYTTSSESEALAVQFRLQDAGIEVFLSDRLPNTFVGIPVAHRLQVWVSKHDATRATRTIEAMNLISHARRLPSSDSRKDIEIVCHRCSTPNRFPQKLIGTIQTCAKCSAYLDVGEVDWGDEAGKASTETEPTFRWRTRWSVKVGLIVFEVAVAATLMTAAIEHRGFAAGLNVWTRIFVVLFIAASIVFFALNLPLRKKPS